MDAGLLVARISQRLLERNYKVAIAEVEPALKQPEDTLNGFGPQLRTLLGKAQRWTGDEAAAKATFGRLRADIMPLASKVDDTFVPVTLAIAQAYLGESGAAVQQAQRALTLYANDANIGPNAEAGLAEVLLVTGDHTGAIVHLRALLNESTSVVTPALLRLDPTWDALHGDPQFESLQKEPNANGKAAGPQ
jgi:Flp pilus assembly protein TadD